MSAAPSKSAVLGLVVALAGQLALACHPVASAPRSVEIPAASAEATPVPPGPDAEPRLDIHAALREFEALEPRDREGFCRKHTGYDHEEYEDCSLKLLGNRTALLLTITTGCGGDSCDVVAWLFTGALEQPFPIDAGGGVVEAAPDGSFVLVDDVVARDPNPLEWGIQLTRIDVPSGQRRPFADCFSPRLSPGGRWILCRDRRANVLRVPLSGGVPELVAESGANAEAIDWVPYAYVYPDPVEFPSPGELVYQIAYADGALAQFAVAWSD